MAGIMFVFGAAMQDPLWPDQPTGHMETDCTRCHPLVADIGATSFSPTDFSRECRTCHSARIIGTTDFARSFHQSGAVCTDCHSFHETSRLRVGEADFSVGDRNNRRTGQCGACHSSGSLANLSEGHRAATAFYHSDRPLKLSASQSCLACHGAESKIVTGIRTEGTPTFAEHGSHPVGIEVVPGSGVPGNRIRAQLDSRLRLVDGRIECQTCHDLTAGNPSRLVTFENQNQLCRGCHEPD